MTAKLIAALAVMTMLLGFAARLGHADPGAAAPGGDGRGGVTLHVAGDELAPATSTTMSPHKDLVSSNGAGMAIIFWIFAATTIGGALFVVTRRNLIAAVMGMVGTFLGIAAVYMLLYASFLAVMQMLVYAGAIMVLFVFVIMILNRPEDHPVGSTGTAGKAIGALAIVYLLGRLAFILVRVKAPAAALLAPGATPEGHAWGSVKALGTELFTGYLFPFEAISILLLVAVVGAIAIARPLKDDEETAAGTGQAEPGAARGGAH